MSQLSQMTQPARATDTPGTFKIEGIHCGSCVARIEAGLKRAFPQLSDVRVNLTTGVAVIESPKGVAIGPQKIVEAIQALGYQARWQPADSTQGQSDSIQGENAGESGDTEQAKAKRRFILSVLLTLPLFALHMTGWNLANSGWIQLGLATPVLFYCGLPIFKSAWRLLQRGESNMDTLIALGAGVAWLASLTTILLDTFSSPSEFTPSILNGGMPHVAPILYFETSAMIITLILVGRYLESCARGKAGEAITALMRLQPQTTWVQRNGDWVEVPVGSVPVGTTVMVRPGGQIPLDGVVLEGQAWVNEAMMTGESVPVAKSRGDVVMGGTVLSSVGNESGNLILQVTQIGAQTVLARIIALVNEAQTSKPPIQRLADQVAGVFVPVVLALSLLTLLGWLLTGHPLSSGLNAAIAVLVIACPCALGLATPTAIQVGLGRAASKGILIRKPEGLELARKLDVLVMDKTGTLTMGQPEVILFEPCLGPSMGGAGSASTGSQRYSPAYSMSDCLRWSAALESRSEHPLARAVLAYAKAHIPADTVTGPLQHFVSQAGSGISAQVEGRRILIGKADYLALHGVVVAPVSERLEAAAMKGHTPVLLAVENQLAGVFYISDPLKSDVAEAIERLRGMQIKPVMLSGDRLETAHAVGRQAGLRPTEIKAEVSPQEKLQFLKTLQQIQDGNGRAAIVGMVGDGINDAPALAQADVSIALGTGTDIAMQTAQMTLVQGDILKVVEAIALSRAIVRTIHQNLFWAFGYNLIALPLAALGWMNPMIAAGAMALSSISVVLNSLRLRRA